MTSVREDVVAPRPPRLQRCGQISRSKRVVLPLVLLTIGLAWFEMDRRQAAGLAHDARVVVRFPAAFISEFSPKEIRETLPIHEEQGKFLVTGTADAVGHVTVALDAGRSRHGDAVLLVRVQGETRNDLIARQTSVEIAGDGYGTFEATREVHFDGRRFQPGPIHVEATHVTEIRAVRSLDGSFLQGVVRLLAAREARQMLPEFNAFAAQRIEERVAQRLDESLAGMLDRLNRANPVNDLVARLHPGADGWRIAVSASQDHLQAALIPASGNVPVLPPAQGSTPLEVWMRLTHGERLGLGLLDRWSLSHYLLRGYLPVQTARALSNGLAFEQVGDWTHVRLGAGTIGAG